MESRLWLFREGVKVISVWTVYGILLPFLDSIRGSYTCWLAVLLLIQVPGTQTPVSSACVEAFLQPSRARLPGPALLMWSPFCDPGVPHASPTALWWGLFLPFTANGGELVFCVSPKQKSWRLVCCLCCFDLGDSGVQTLTSVTSS